MRTRSNNITSKLGSPGYGFTLTAIVAATIMGIVILSFNRLASVQSRVFLDAYGSSQAYWSALSGIEYGLFESIEGVYENLGSKTFYQGSVFVDTSDSDDDGTALGDYWTRFTSTATVGNSERYLRFLAVISMKAVWGDVSVIEGTGDFTIDNNHTLNDSLYVGQNITVAAGATVGAPPNDPTRLFHPTGTTVSPSSGTYYTSGQHRYDELFIPTFDTDPYDSLLTLAAASGTGNEFFRKNTMDTLDLTTYPDCTLYASGTVTISGVYIKGGTLERPGIIAATGTITLGPWTTGGNTYQVQTDDNVILVSNSSVVLNDSTYFGEDHTSELPIWTEVSNLVFSYVDIRLTENATVWGQFYAQDDIKIQGRGYGIAYAPDRFTFDKATSYFEGAIFAKKVFGATASDELDVGQMNLTYHYHEEWFKTYQLGFSDRTLREF